MSSDVPHMRDKKPYLLRALYDWIIESGCTPHLVVAHPSKGWVTGVPAQHMQDEILVLNISPSATPNCTIEESGIYFSARFSGQPCNISVDMRAVASIVAKETQDGMMFEIDNSLLAAGTGTCSDSSTSAKADKKNHLHIVR